MRPSLMLALWFATPAAAATLDVGPGRTYATLVSALDASADGDTLEVYAGTYAGNYNLTKDVDIVAMGAAVVAGTNATLLTIDNADVTITGVDFEASGGRALRVVGGTLTLEDADVSGNTNGIEGAAIRVENGTLHVIDCTMDDNRADDQKGGHIYANGATVTIEGSTLDNGRSGSGGAIRAEGTDLTIEDSTFTANGVLDVGFLSTYSNVSAGAIYARNSTLTITDTDFADGYAESRGAGIAAYDSTVSITGGSFSGHDLAGTLFDAGRGGAVHLDNSDLTSAGVSYTSNNADRGGAIQATSGSSVSLNADIFELNTAAYGGGLRFDSNNDDMTLVGVTFTDNSSTAYGGAISMSDAGDISISDSEFVGNSSERGGAISFYGADSLSVERSRFCGNSSTDDAGAVRVASIGVGTWTNNLFEENTSGDDGGSVYVDDSSAQTFRNNTFAGGSASEGGGFWTADTTVDFRNNIVGWVSSGRGVWRSSGNLTVAYNLWYLNGNDTQGVTRSTNAVQSDPLLLGANAQDGDCSNNLLQPNPTSPALDAGDPAYLDPDGSRSDIGAYGGDGAPIELFTDADADGVTGLYDCDDTNASVYPGADEICDDLDQNCDGLIDNDAIDAPPWYADNDADGYGSGVVMGYACVVPVGGAPLDDDCDDTESLVSPGGLEVCNQVDDNCDGILDNALPEDATAWYIDRDGDGYGDERVVQRICERPDGYVLEIGDCDDESTAVYPGADEICDEADNDCDGAVDEDAIDPNTYFRDADADGYGTDETIDACEKPLGYSDVNGDCDDADYLTYPYAPESCDELIDRNCDGSVGDADLDADGVIACEDCDDRDPSVYPGADEVYYDGVDQDCDGLSDFDADQDGYDASEYGGDDCDDTNPEINPGMEEVYGNSTDSNCDGEIGENPFYDEKLRAAGCGCSQSGGAPMISWLLLLAPWLRRRHTSRID